MSLPQNLRHAHRHHHLHQQNFVSTRVRDLGEFFHTLSLQRIQKGISLFISIHKKKVPNESQ